MVLSQVSHGQFTYQSQVAFNVAMLMHNHHSVMLPLTI